MGEVIPLNNHPVNRSIRIIGLSDSPVYAKPLKKTYDYINTFFHEEPFLDICSPSPKYRNSADLLISSDVFEHVNPPSLNAFVGAAQVLKPGGALILTVPYMFRDESFEHYPEDVIGYRSYQVDSGDWEVELEHADGRKTIADSPKFHGGPGSTLEMRVFNQTRLERELTAAGFSNIVFHTENTPEYGVYWEKFSRVITANKPG